MCQADALSLDEENGVASSQSAILVVMPGGNLSDVKGGQIRVFPDDCASGVIVIEVLMGAQHTIHRLGDV